MPDLPNVGMERDMESFREFFESPDFRTDGLKLYPTLVIRGTGLYELWRTGRYRNYAPDRLVDLVARALALVPPWVRVYRVQRDIPMPLVTAGVEKGNLRELALARMGDLGLRCRDVRTREVGIQDIHSKVRPEEVELVRRDYTANGEERYTCKMTSVDPWLERRERRLVSKIIKESGLNKTPFKFNLSRRYTTEAGKPFWRTKTRGRIFWWVCFGCGDAGGGRLCTP